MAFYVVVMFSLIILILNVQDKDKEDSTQRPWNSHCAPTYSAVTSGTTSTINDMHSNNTGSRFKTNFQFPSVEDRIKFYMGSWYTKDLNIPHPQSASNSSLCSGLYIPTARDKIMPETTTLYSLTTLKKRSQMPKLFHAVYLKDAANILSHVESRIDQSGEDEEKYVILSPGDGYSTDEHKPVVAKTRRYIHEHEKRGIDYYRPIVWPIRLQYHFTEKLDQLKIIQDTGKDTPWNLKKEVVVWRGVCTGAEGRHTSTGFRLPFTHKHKDNRPLGGDVAMVDSCTPFNIKSDIKVDRSFFRSRISMQTLLSHKYLLNLEGNDVSTGLKWMLASSSLVFMPTPSAVSFAMENELVPYVHYVPVKNDGSDLLEQLRWAKQNDEQCRWMSEQASAYMNDLWLSAQAQKDYIFIKHTMGTMYYENFNKGLAMCHPQQKYSNHVARNLG